MNFFSQLWLNTSSIFDAVQYIFNRDFWGAFTENFGNFSGQKVLDIACGTGKMRCYINPKYYLGIDINKKYIELAKKNYRKLDETYFLEVNACKYKPSGNFDTVFLVGSAHHLSNEQIKKICKIVQKIHFKQFLVVDGIPKGPLSNLLKWLDAMLGGGKYFRTEKEIEVLLKDYFKIKEVGKIYVKGSFYYYPYVMALA